MSTALEATVSENSYSLLDDLVYSDLSFLLVK